MNFQLFRFYLIRQTQYHLHDDLGREKSRIAGYTIFVFGSIGDDPSCSHLMFPRIAVWIWYFVSRLGTFHIVSDPCVICMYQGA